MARYTPPEQGKAMQFVDIAFLVVAIFVALWLPLKLGLAGAAKEITKIDNPTWENLGQNPTMVAAWEKLGYTAQTAHDVIQNRFNYRFGFRFNSFSCCIIYSNCFLLFSLFCGFFSSPLHSKGSL